MYAFFTSMIFLYSWESEDEFDDINGKDPVADQFNKEFRFSQPWGGLVVAWTIWMVRCEVAGVDNVDKTIFWLLLASLKDARYVGGALQVVALLVLVVVLLVELVLWLLFGISLIQGRPGLVESLKKKYKQYQKQLTSIHFPLKIWIFKFFFSWFLQSKYILCTGAEYEFWQKITLTLRFHVGFVMDFVLWSNGSSQNRPFSF